MKKCELEAMAYEVLDLEPYDLAAACDEYAQLAGLSPAQAHKLYEVASALQ